MSLGLQTFVAMIWTLSLSALKDAAFKGFSFLGLCDEMTQITDLPVEILARIFTLVPVKDHAALSEVCRTFNYASKIDYIWIHRCMNEFNISPFISEFSYQEIYTKLLYKYGDLLGLWQPEVSSYGGLLEISFDSGKIIGSEFCLPFDANIRLPLEKTSRFVIELNEKCEVEIKCFGCDQSLHKAEITGIEKDAFSFKCRELQAHSTSHDNLINWFRDESRTPFNRILFPHSQELLLMKYLILCQYNYCYKYNRIRLPKKCDNVPIQPGLFKGTYGAHGIELIMLEYDENYTTAKATKITGDPNIPAGKITFKAELNHSMFLTRDQQISIAQLERISRIPARYDPKDMRAQPFQVPFDCDERFKDIPRTCTARFHGTGQIAGHGYSNPSFTNGHWIIFDEDLFGFLWLDLLSLSVYHRVQENFLQ